MLSTVLTLALAGVFLELFSASSTPQELRLPAWRRTPAMHVVAVVDGALLFWRLAGRPRTQPRL